VGKNIVCRAPTEKRTTNYFLPGVFVCRALWKMRTAKIGTHGNHRFSRSVDLHLEIIFGVGSAIIRTWKYSNF
jgi:hypothetical protein